MLRAQPIQHGHDFLLANLQRIGDHARGLFEAQASIAVSAAHLLENVDIFVVIGHKMPFHVLTIKYRIQSAAPENPTCCVVISSVVATGVPLVFTVTRTRTKIRHGSPHRKT